MIPEKQLNWLKNRLLETKNRLELLIRGSRQTEDFGSDVDHGEEESDETEEIITNDSVRRTLREHLGNILSALAKINDHKYGVCENCGKEISLDLLKVDPESRLCKNCKARLR
ncbi:MAG: TraR/DksA C4-type zinc finger protein [Candidatus Colwellbacteria bacterium]|nr:TraR/DksA C4-type zinc finger protein [Candidatus Colwellbacteria bacterium]